MNNVVGTLGITRLINFNQAAMFVVISLKINFDWSNIIDSEIVRSRSAFFGKTRSEMGYRSP